MFSKLWNLEMFWLTGNPIQGVFVCFKSSRTDHLICLVLRLALYKESPCNKISSNIGNI